MDDNKGLTLEDVKEVLREAQQTEGAIRREVDSLDDFEHLGHDDGSPPSKGARDGIDIGVGLPKLTTGKSDELSSFDPFTVSAPPLSADPGRSHKTMDSNLLEMGDHFPDRKEADDKIDKFLQEMSSFAPHQTIKHPEESNDKDDYFKSSTQSFVDAERGPPVPPKKTTSDSSSSGVEQLEKYSDSEPEDDDFKPSKYEHDFPKKAELPESADHFKGDALFKDVEEPEPEPPRKDYPVPPIFDDGNISPIAPVAPPKVEKVPEVIPEAPKVPEVRPEPVCKLPVEKDVTSKPRKSNVIDAEAIFCRMGLDTWFNPERLNPKVESLIYWRDPKKSGPVFGGVLLILLSLTYFSLISVVAYLSLAALTGTISFRIYKNIVQAVQKTGDGHPFKGLLEYDVSLPQEKVKDVSEVAVAHINAGVSELRRLFLVEDLVDSIKFGVLLWTLTYLGSWFNGMTLIIIAWVALFSLPKVYETNKTQIDANLEIVRTKLAEITSKVKAAIPIGKKAEEKKEQ